MNENKAEHIQKFFISSLFLVCLFQLSSVQADDQAILVSTLSEPIRDGISSDLHSDWEIKVWTGVPEVRVLNDRGGHVLRLRSHQSSIAVHKRVPVDLNKHSHSSKR